MWHKAGGAKPLGNINTFIAAGLCFALSNLALLVPAMAQKPGSEAGTVIGQHRYLPTLRFDGRTNYMAGRIRRTGGLKVGVEVDNRHEWGLGIAALQQPIEFKTLYVDRAVSPAPMPYNAEMGFNYFNVYYEYALLNTYRWKLVGQYTQGFGRTLSRLSTIDGNVEKYQIRRPLHTFEPGLTLERVLTGITGIALEGGYRWVNTDRKVGQPRISGPFVALRFKIYIGEALRIGSSKLTKLKKEKEEPNPAVGE